MAVIISYQNTAGNYNCDISNQLDIHNHNKIWKKRRREVYLHGTISGK